MKDSVHNSEIFTENMDWEDEKKYTTHCCGGDE
jgi:hypothetical protein